MASRIDSIYNTSIVPTYETHQEKSPVCYCPACLGLQCLERPRYFAGQLLTEAELNSEQAYVIAKNKLHNRYLHGWGVVCGLQVVCHDCDGWVTVKQGYAIDPCGNDIIVCDDQDFDVLKAIRECREGRKRRRRADCDPIKAPDDKSCSDIEEHWCITIEYAEKEARPITPLRNEKKGNCGCGCGSSCGCGCGGGNGNGKSNGKSCGCGCQGAQSSTQGATAKPNAQCEPTRIYEQYRLNVVEEPEDCCNRHSRDKGRSEYYSTDDVWSSNPRLTGYMNALSIAKSQQAMILQVLSILPQDSMLTKIINCLLYLADFVRARLSRDDLFLLRRIIRDCDCRRRRGDDNTIGVFENSEAMHRLCCNLQRLVSDLYSQNPLNVRCDYSCPPCPPMGTPPPDPAVAGGPGTYDQSPEMASICCLAERLLQYAVDCICQAFLPPCPPNPEDDRLILACLTIKNGKIINICNFSCRHYAGSFPSLYYWMSLVPVIPLFGKLIQCICCDPHILQTLFDVFEPRNRGNEIVINNEGNANEFTVQSKRNQFGDIIRRILMHCFNFEEERNELYTRGARAPESGVSDLDDLREQIKALRAEMETLKGGEPS